MRKNRYTSGLLVAISMLALASAAFASSPAFKLDDGVGNVITMNAAGTVTFSGNASCIAGTTCKTSTVTPSSSAGGKLDWTGTIGTFTLNVHGETSPPQPAATIDLALNNVATGASGGTLTASFTDVGFYATGPTTLSIGTDYTGGTNTLTNYTGYVDNTNTPFGTLLNSGSTGLGSSTFGFLNGVWPATGSVFSLTAVSVIQMDANTQLASSDFGYSAVALAPPVGSIVGTVWSDTNANGLLETGEPGLTGWTVTLSGASSATATTSSGAFSFPNLAAGAYNVCVTPLATYTLTYPLGGTANCATFTLTAGQNVTNANFGYVAAGAGGGGGSTNTLSLSCAPATTATVGVPFSSAVVVSGGTAPYLYAISAGALPAGLKLNTATGAIAGTPTSPVTANFTVSVTDSTGAIAYSSCSGTCTGGVTVATGLNSHLGNLGKTAGFTTSGITFTAYGFTNAGIATALYGQNSYGASGLGIAGAIGNQIDTGNFVQVDISQAIALGATNAQILITGLNSCQGGESYDIYGSNTLGSIGTLLTTAGTQNGKYFSLSQFPKWKYIGVRAHAGNVLFGGISFTVPTSCSITVSGPLHVTCPQSSATVGQPYSSTPKVTGGTAPYKYEIGWGTLPPGLVMLNPLTGTITGTPTTAGTTAFKIKVTDANGTVDYSDCSGSCFGGTIVSHDYKDHVGSMGQNQSYKDDGLSSVVRAYETSGRPSSLYGHNEANNSTGIGIYGGAGGNRIDSSHFVQCDISGFVKAGATDVQIAINDLQQGESYDVYGSNTLGSQGTLLISGGTRNHTYFDVPNFKNYKYISVKGHGSSTVLLGGLSSTYPCTCSIDVSGGSGSSGGSNGGTSCGNQDDGYGHERSGNRDH